MLPLEAIELDAFRRKHEHDTFWCGLLLGGCGLQLTTKLYTDRVCHFAHHPGSNGVAHECARRARGVSSADHLYVKAAATAWLHGRGERAEFHFARPDGADIGSVLDIRFPRRALRVHLDHSVKPEWDREAVEPVLGMSMPVDSTTLIRRWYVHRIRLDSEGTTRRVQIGTQAFAREIDWFAFDECEMTPRGLSTPAVQEIVRSRITKPVSTWGVKEARKVPDLTARAQLLLRELAKARQLESASRVAQLCREITLVEGVEDALRAQLSDAVVEAEDWLETQAQARALLFSRLEEAVAAADLPVVRHLTVLVNGTASHDRSEAERAVAQQAAALLAEDLQERQEEILEAAQEAERARRAAERVRAQLTALRRRPSKRRPVAAEAVRDAARKLVRAAEEAGDLLTARERELVETWRKRVGRDTGRESTDRIPGPGQPPEKRGPRQVGCPACGAEPGVRCAGDGGTHPSRVARARRAHPTR
ncbi:hypothetical protein ACFWBI_36860 [Streptomyces sp. NPDC059982]|uniref:zinc finger domain-containing protein n=1 Tax=unclassified Streptomyces TaxID=2593676 RepID=UPI00367B4766